MARTTPPSDAAATDAAATGTVRALQTVLAAEHAAVYGFGVVGAHVSGSARDTATHEFRRHRARRDALRRMVVKRGGTPVASRGTYKLPFTVTGADDAARLAAHLENAVAGAYLALVAVDDDKLRLLGAKHVASGTERAVDWDAKPTAFPGLPASALR